MPIGPCLCSPFHEPNPAHVEVLGRAVALFGRPTGRPFGPTKSDGIDAKSWIQTLKGRAFIVALRLYGVGTEFYDQTWKPNDVVKLK